MKHVSLHPHAGCKLSDEIRIRIDKQMIKCKRNPNWSIQANMGQKGFVGKLQLVRLVLENF